MRELERKKKIIELKKKEKKSQEVYQLLNKEFLPVEKEIFNEYLYISDKNGFSDRFRLKHKVENRLKNDEKKEYIKIPKLSLSDIIEIECLKNQISKRSKSE